MKTNEREVNNSMKKLSALFLAMLMLLLLASCGGKGNDAQTTAPSGETVSSTGQATGAKVNYMAIYGGLLNEYYDFIVGFSGDADVPDGFNGIAAVIPSYGSSDEVLDNFGYAVKDINGDGVDELMICPFNELAEQTVIAVYTCVDKQPQLLAEGWYRNAYYLLNDGTIGYIGSGGAAYSYMGVYEIAANLKELDCKEYYFTLFGDEEGSLNYYTNSIGEDIVSESTLISEAAFRAKNDDISDRAVSFEITAFSTLSRGAEKPTDKLSVVMTAFASDIIAYDPDEWDYSLAPPYETYIAYEGDDGVYVGFMQEGIIRDFKFYSLENVDFVDGKLVFDKTELYSRATLSSESPVLIRMCFPGTMPSYAISFVDEQGTKAYGINLSGEDGSIIFEEIEM